jgi:hypothetical protein
MRDEIPRLPQTRPALVTAAFTIPVFGVSYPVGNDGCPQAAGSDSG